MKTLSQLMPIPPDSKKENYRRVWSKFIKADNWDYWLIEFDTWTNIKWYVVVDNYSNTNHGRVILSIDDDEFYWWYKIYDSFWSLLQLSDPDIKSAVDNILKASLKDMSEIVSTHINKSLDDVTKSLEETLDKVMHTIKKYAKIINSPEMQAKFITRIVDIISKKTKDIIVWKSSSEWIFSFLKKW